MQKYKAEDVCITSSFNEAKQYQKKPGTIRAIQFDGTERQAKYIKNLIPSYSLTRVSVEVKLSISTLIKANMVAIKGDWIISKNGDISSVCSDSVFKETYEEES